MLLFELSTKSSSTGKAMRVRAPNNPPTDLSRFGTIASDRYR